MSRPWASPSCSAMLIPACDETSRLFGTGSASPPPHVSDEDERAEPPGRRSALRAPFPRAGPRRRGAGRRGAQCIRLRRHRRETLAIAASAARTATAAAHGSYACADGSGPRAGPGTNAVSTAPAPAERCRVVRRAARARLDAARAAGRAARAAAPPPPTRSRDDELDRAYAGWYRPDAGRFSGPGDALLRRSRGHLARRLDEIAPAGPGARRRLGRRRPARRARGARAQRASASSAPARDPTCAAARSREIEGPWAAIVFWHSLEHLRDAGAALDHARSTCSRPRASW